MMASDRPRRRRLSAEERALWHTVTRSVAPLGRKAGPADIETASEPEATTTAPARRPPRPVEKSAREPPPLNPLDRRSRQRLARGTDPIDARIDLHGRTQGQAHAALLRFLRKAQADGARTVLVITGKGDAAGERGVLKRQVPLWLELPEFRELLLGFADAGIGHGGGGALYVRLRRRRA
jgi:DNA-nicking Smr family endonuclease